MEIGRLGRRFRHQKPPSRRVRVVTNVLETMLIKIMTEDLAGVCFIFSGLPQWTNQFEHRTHTKASGHQIVLVHNRVTFVIVSHGLCLILLHTNGYDTQHNLDVVTHNHINICQQRDTTLQILTDNVILSDSVAPASPVSWQRGVTD